MAMCTEYREKPYFLHLPFVTLLRSLWSLPSAPHHTISPSICKNYGRGNKKSSTQAQNKKTCEEHRSMIVGRALSSHTDQTTPPLELLLTIIITARPKKKQNKQKKDRRCVGEYLRFGLETPTEICRASLPPGL